MSYTVLNDQQVDRFLNYGYIKIEGCFSSTDVNDWIGLAFKRLGYVQNKPSTWIEDRIHLPPMNRVEVADFSPKAWGAICDLMGGVDRIKMPVHWADSFIINFNLGAHQPWQPPSPQIRGWHKDGDWFRHFLDSPEQGLLTIILWNDVQPKSGGTFIATDSVAPIAKYLLQYPQGLTPKEAQFGQLIDQCQQFQEVTGQTGDVFLLHPYMLHAASQNPSGRPRIITNPAVSFRQPMNFNRSNSADYNLIERAVLRALQVNKLDFEIKQERERITPERVHRQRKMIKEQKTRLASA